jgi:hypothetical protein
MRALALMFIAATCFAAEADQPFEWHGSLSPGLAVEIRGLNGDVHAVASDSNQVEVYAHVKSETGEPQQVRVRVVQHEHGLTFCAVSPSNKSGDCSVIPGLAGAEARVDFTVRVPKGVGLIGRTVNGEVDARDLSGDVNAETVNGRIQISTWGKAAAKTVNGSIIAVMKDQCATHAAQLSTVNGDITIQVPSIADTSFRAETVHGAITSEFAKLHGGSHHVNNRTGHGSRAINLKTVNGSIQVRKAG